MVKHVVSGSSDHSVIDSATVLRAMIPDSKIASMIDLGKDK